MSTLADYSVVNRPPTILAPGNNVSFNFDAPAVDALVDTVLFFRVFPTMGAGLTMTINGAPAFSVSNFAVEGGRSLHEVIPAGTVQPAGNVLTAANVGGANVNFGDIVLFYQA